ncbi:MAG TPA: hypothetical protein VGD21_02190 [Lysobacter sp.]
MDSQDAKRFFQTRWRAALAVMVLCTGLADARASSERAVDEREPNARAHLDFRIVVPERLQLPSLDTRHERNRRFTSRTVETQRDRIRVTVSRP